MLTQDDKKNIMDKFASRIAGDYIRKQVRGAKNTQDAIKKAKHNGIGGWGTTGEMVMGDGKGINIKRYNGAETNETITWKEFVDYIRSDTEQISMF
mgnify:CR=1 FL=1